MSFTNVETKGNRSPKYLFEYQVFRYDNFQKGTVCVSLMTYVVKGHTKGKLVVTCKVSQSHVNHNDGSVWTPTHCIFLFSKYIEY